MAFAALQLDLAQTMFLASLRGGNGAWRPPKGLTFEDALARAYPLPAPARGRALTAAVGRSLCLIGVLEPLVDVPLPFVVRHEYALRQPEVRRAVIERVRRIYASDARTREDH